MQQLTIAQLTKLLTRYIKQGLPTITFGPPGCAKTALAQQIAVALGREYLAFHPQTDETTKYSGYPWLVKSENGEVKARHIMFDDFAELLSPSHDQGIIAHLDDLIQAPKSIQNCLMHPLRERRIGRHKIHDSVTFVLSSNRRIDRVGGETVMDTIVSRCAAAWEVRPDVDSFLNGYWYANNKRPEVAGYLRFRPDHLFHDPVHKRTTFKPQGSHENYPNFRTWDAVSTVLEMELGADEGAAICAAIGQAVGGEFAAYLPMARSIPDVDKLIQHPDLFRLPKELGVLSALVSAMIHRTTTETWEPILRICEYLSTSDRADYAGYMFAGLYAKIQAEVRAITSEPKRTAVTKAYIQHPQWKRILDLPMTKLMLADEKVG